MQPCVRLAFTLPYLLYPTNLDMHAKRTRGRWRTFVHGREDVVGLDCSVICSPKVWEASGHAAGFSDPMVDCRATKLRYRADQLLFAQVGGLGGRGGRGCSALLVVVAVTTAEVVVVWLTAAGVESDGRSAKLRRRIHRLTEVATRERSCSHAGCRLQPRHL